MTAERFDAVLADIRQAAIGWWAIPALSNTMTKLADRLQSAHAADVAEVRESARHEAVAMGLLADRAVGLLRECRPLVDTCPDLTRPGGDELGERIDAFLSEQAGERENGDG